MTIPESNELEELKNIPNIVFYDTIPYYTKRVVNKNGMKFEIECYYEDVVDSEEFVIQEITYMLLNEDIYIRITEYDTDNFDIYIRDNENVFSREYESNVGESLYFKNVNVIIDLFRNPESYVKDKIKEYLDKYKGEIPEVLREKVEKTLEKI
jgi:hypothetical protein